MAHLGTCTQCAGEGDVITIEADPIPLSLFPACLALILARSSGTRRAIRERWRDMHRRRSERRVELERKARVNLERVAKLRDGNGRDGSCPLAWLFGINPVLV